jgi:hypothetical protein
MQGASPTRSAMSQKRHRVVSDDQSCCYDWTLVEQSEVTSGRSLHGAPNLFLHQICSVLSATAIVRVAVTAVIAAISRTSPVWPVLLVWPPVPIDP